MKKLVSILLILTLTLTCFAVAETTENTTYLIDDAEVIGTVCKARFEDDRWERMFERQSNEELFTFCQSSEFEVAMAFVVALTLLQVTSEIPSDFQVLDIDISSAKMCMMTDGVLLFCFNFYSDNRVGYFACYPSTTEFSCGIFETESTESSKTKVLQNVINLLNDDGYINSYIDIPITEVLSVMSALRN